MNIENEKALPKRKSTRLKGFDYSSAGAYFVTICTKDRKRILSHIVKPSSPVGVGAHDDPLYGAHDDPLYGAHDDPLYGAHDAPLYGDPLTLQIQLTEIGKIVEKYLLSSEKIPGVKIDQYVIMPDHIHAIIFIYPDEYTSREDGSSRAPHNGSSRAPTPTNGSSRAPHNGSSRAPTPTNGSSKAPTPTNGSSRAPTPTGAMLPHIVSTFKRFCNKEIGDNVFQRGYMEHIVRDGEDYETRRKYIYENPTRWYYKYSNE